MNTMAIETKKITSSDLMNLPINEILTSYDPPYFRILKVYSGWLYNFWDEKTNDYSSNWIFVPIK